MLQHSLLSSYAPGDVVEGRVVGFRRLCLALGLLHVLHPTGCTVNLLCLIETLLPRGSWKEAVGSWEDLTFADTTCSLASMSFFTCPEQSTVAVIERCGKVSLPRACYWHFFV